MHRIFTIGAGLVKIGKIGIETIKYDKEKHSVDVRRRY